MGRKKKPKDPAAKECDRCGQFVHGNAPMSGLVTQVGPDLVVICCSCAVSLAQMWNQLMQRWG